MSTSNQHPERFSVNAGVNSQVELIGLLGQHVWYFAGFAIGIFFLLLILNAVGVPSYLLVAGFLVGIIGSYLHFTTASKQGDQSRRKKAAQRCCGRYHFHDRRYLQTLKFTVDERNHLKGK